MTVESPYQRRQGEAPDPLDPTAAGYPADGSETAEEYTAEHETPHEESGAQSRSADSEDLGEQREPAWAGGAESEPESEGEGEAEGEPGEAEADPEAAWSRTAEPEGGAASEEEPAAFTPEGTGLGEREEEAPEQGELEQGEPEGAAFAGTEPEAAVPAVDEDEDEEEEEEAAPDELVVEEAAIEATEPDVSAQTPLEPEVGEAVSSGSLIGAEPTPGFADPAGAAPVADTIIPAELASVFATRLRDIQVAFIDDPGKAAEDADRLLGEVVREFAAGVEAQRGALQPGSAEGGSPQTEDLRLALQRYRKLLDVLLSC